MTMSERLTSTHSLATVGLENLSPEHFEVLQQGFWTILFTDLATETFAQVVDGRPTRDVYRDYFNEFRKSFENNIHPSNAALEAVESYRRNLNLGSTQISAKLAQALQNAKPGSREFHLRLIETLAVLCHGIAVHLYQAYDGGFYKPEPPDPITWHEELVPNMPPPPPRKALPAELYHFSYGSWSQYPNGVADIVGYWAEYRLFGGVVLFDRGETGFECKDIFIHPVGRYMIFQLSETQVQAYISFLQGGPQPPCGIRFKAEEYARRVDKNYAMDMNIYRDRYERIIPKRRARCIIRGEDLPGHAQAMEDWARRTGNS
ncbi:hypothetical protein H112_08985 [Trichophyton rubrum D6]|nr:hypothetical protein H100_09008 [Trichophyton rubrum MR850]EZF36529.1 hypothetical protein H102_08966 [Trichophyton rubrum CBS 100081]EZF47207.1 hypothetical protein H103_08989 [Trichophyton rubrum CBS 288.86]EZF57889.1 hypothetical protein H104_08937 [Trichophyton rubrum CBS 289.86]EZF68477.1 hypothetical protein H105_08994 [Trichophyton soudanense CBS 452.61]EZF79179.1 hypothetical protein H110_08989 [Trichophyton rubrum MR1448]EZG11376.1 hypothetical protein H107_09146 [Trichophyton rub